MAIFSLEPQNITLLWLPSGIALIMFILFGNIASLGVFVASFAANIDGLGGITNTNAIFHSIISAGADSLAGYIAWSFYKFFLPDGLSKSRDLIPFLFFVCLTTSFITALLLGLNLLYGGYIQRIELHNFVEMIVLADSLGIILVFPIYLGWKDGFHPNRELFIWSIIGAFAIAVIFLLVLSGLEYVLFLLLPIIFLLSFKTNLIITSVATSICMIGIAILAAKGVGPFIGNTNSETAYLIVTFMFSTTIIILVLSIQSRQLELNKEITDSLFKAAQIDELTGLLNRRAFFELVNNELVEQSTNPNYSYALAMLDLDCFKKINDEFGHAAGDRVLHSFADKVRKHIPQENIAARIGGEEFVIFLPNAKVEQALLLLEQLRNEVANYAVEFENKKIKVTVSVGLTECDDLMSEFDSIMCDADVALYKAKEKGKNKIVVASIM